MLGPVETLFILGENVKSLPALVRKELVNSSVVLMLHRPRSFLPHIVSEFLSTIRFMISYMMTSIS